MRLSELIQGLPIVEARGDAEITGVCVDSSAYNAATCSSRL
jgi:hypothetical protein